MKPKQLYLSVYSEFKAAHSLEGFETPHFHLWKVEVEFASSLNLKKGKVIDLVYLETMIKEIYAPLENQNLNTKLKALPTSENLALWFWEQIEARLGNPIQEATLHSVSITLCSVDGVASGRARLQ